jgi:hypothetical protein
MLPSVSIKTRLIAMAVIAVVSLYFAEEARGSQLLAQQIPNPTYQTIILDPGAGGEAYGPGRAFGDDLIDTEIPKEGVPKLDTKNIDEHLIINEKGLKDICSAGSEKAKPWDLVIKDLDSKEELVSIIQTAIENDLRIRSVKILDNRLDMYFLLPAKWLGFIPVNYHMQITATAETFHMGLETPDLLKYVRHDHEDVKNSFRTYIPQFLTKKVVDDLADENIFVRHAVLVKVISETMARTNLYPDTSSFFVCYILPFLLYILIIIGILVGMLWFIIRKARGKKPFRYSTRYPEDPDYKPNQESFK